MESGKQADNGVATARFLWIVLGIYAIINSYLFYTGWAAIGYFGGSRHYFTIIAGMFMLAYPVGRLLERHWPNILSDGLIFIGSLYVGSIVYFLMASFLADGLWFATLLFGTPLSPSFIQIYFYLTILAVSGLLVYGYWNARQIRFTHLDLTLSGNHPLPMNPLRLVVFSDIHLGTIIRHRDLVRIVEQVNRFNPHLILIPGDILDENLPPKRWASTLAPLSALKAPLGVYATTGNHEYFIRNHNPVRAVQQTGITVLEDAVVTPLPGLVLVGRRDPTGKYYNEPRKPLGEILQDVSKDSIIVVMDHQPVHLEEAVAAGVTLQVSGHTHAGQFWPFTWINNRVWEISYGYRQKGNTHFYVTSGVGAWGPPIRIGTQAEIVIMDIQFT